MVYNGIDKIIKTIDKYLMGVMEIVFIAIIVIYIRSFGFSILNFILGLCVSYFVSILIYGLLCFIFESLAEVNDFIFGSFDEVYYQCVNKIASEEEKRTEQKLQAQKRDEMLRRLEEARIQEEIRAQEEAKRRAEEEAKRRAQAEAKRRAEEEAKRRAQEETKKKAQEEAKRKAQEEAERKAREEQRRKIQLETERRMNSAMKLLGLKADFTEKDLIRAYRKAMVKYHPDSHPEDTDKYTRLTQDIGEAYDKLLRQFKSQKKSYAKSA